jgi:hypothetical protein
MNFSQRSSGFWVGLRSQPWSMFSGNGSGGFKSALIRKGNTSVSLKSGSDWIGFYSVDMERLMGAWETLYLWWVQRVLQFQIHLYLQYFDNWPKTLHSKKTIAPIFESWNQFLPIRIATVHKTREIHMWDFVVPFFDQMALLVHFHEQFISNRSKQFGWIRSYSPKILIIINIGINFVPVILNTATIPWSRTLKMLQLVLFAWFSSSFQIPRWTIRRRSLTSFSS